LRKGCHFHGQIFPEERNGIKHKYLLDSLVNRTPGKRIILLCQHSLSCLMFYAC